MFLGELWNSLDHPPKSYLGNDFAYRSADGSNNSYIFPKLGAANTPYARSVRRKHISFSKLSNLTIASNYRPTGRIAGSRFNI